jgi:hypothetical protein
MALTPSLLSRLQFAFTISFYIYRLLEKGPEAAPDAITAAGPNRPLGLGDQPLSGEATS